MAQSAVDSVYHKLRRMAMDFQFLPGERLNEALLAKDLGVSRTPLREALNRLATDGFLTFSANNGFYRKTVDVKEIFDLYEFRMLLEGSAVKLAVERATDEQIAEIEAFSVESARDVPNRTIEDLVAIDEQFHEMLFRLSANAEMFAALQKINAHIQFVRWVDMAERRKVTQQEHQQIVAAVKRRDATDAQRCIHEHIAHRLDQIVEKVERSYGRIFVRSRQAAPAEMEKSVSV